MGFLYSSKSFIHPISTDYFNRVEAAGGNISDKNSVNEFVIELSKIIPPELWICWLMKSTYNIGTGTSIYTIGGLENVIGTLTGGPTWGADGISFDGSDDRIVTNFKDRFHQYITCLAINRPTVKTDSSALFGSRSVAGGGRTFAPFWNTNITATLTWASTNVAQANAPTAATLNNWNFLYGGSFGTPSSVYAECGTNKTNINQVTGTGSDRSIIGNNFIIGNDGNGSNFFQGTTAAIICIMSPITRENRDAIYELCKRINIGDLS